jgi:hypothetical protein
MDIDHRALLSQRIGLNAAPVMVRMSEGHCMYPLDTACRVQLYFNISGLPFQADKRFSPPVLIDPIRSTS